MRQTARSPLLPVLLLAALLPVAGRVAAQTSRPATPDVDPPPATAPQHLLAGPPVSDVASEPAGRMDAGMQRKPRAQLPARKWMAVLRGLGLTETQRAEARSIMKRFEAKRRAFRRDHRSELRGIRGDIATLRNGGIRDVPESRRKQLRKLAQSRPRVEETQEQVWNLLTPEQQEIFLGELERVRASWLELREQRKQRSRSRSPRRRTKPPADDVADDSST